MDGFIQVGGWLIQVGGWLIQVGGWLIQVGGWFYPGWWMVCATFSIFQDNYNTPGTVHTRSAIPLAAKPIMKGIPAYSLFRGVFQFGVLKQP